MPDTGSSSGSTSSGAEGGSGSTDGTTAGADDSSTGTTDEGGEDSTTTSVSMPTCDGITPTTLFSTTEHIGAPLDVFLLALLSWWDPSTNDFDESADDFVVPEGSCWCVTSVAYPYLVSGEAPAMPELVVNFYDDVDELPGERWFSETTTAVTPGTFADGHPRYDIELAEPVMVPAGRTWMSIVAVVSGTLRMGVRLTTDAADTPSAAHLDKMDCPRFPHYEDCYPGEPAVQLAFEVHGAEIPCDAE